MHADNLKEHYRAVRARLWQTPPPKPVEPEPEPEPEPEVIKCVRTFDWRISLSELCLRHGISPKRILSPDRSKKCVTVRAEMAALLRERGWSLHKIGQALGRDHSSVLSLLKKHTCGIPHLDGLRSPHNCFMDATGRIRHDKQED